MDVGKRLGDLLRRAGNVLHGRGGLDVVLLVAEGDCDVAVRLGDDLFCLVGEGPALGVCQVDKEGIVPNRR